MIIGINGKIGSGKDTVGKIIQYLDAKSREERDRELAPKLFLPDFKYPSFEDWCKPKIHNSGHDIGYSSMYEIADSHWQIKKFAGKLKQVASLLTGIPVEKFEDQEFKKTEMSEEWSVNGMPMTVREFLQKLGTDAVRDGLHSNTWVNALFADYKPIPYFKHEEDLVADIKYPNWIITDVRFPNELSEIKRRGGLVIRVTRGDKMDYHVSETALDDYIFEEEIDNNGTINDLINKVDEILKRRKIL